MNHAKPPRLPPRQQLVAADKWPFVGERSPRDSSAPWELRISGLVEKPTTWSLAELRAMPQERRTLDIHCVTRWSKYDVQFAGIRLLDLLAQAEPTTETRFVSFAARSEQGHSTSLPWAELPELDPLVALTVNDAPLPMEHGGPIRLVTPGRYFYKSVKWLEHIELLASDRLGFWESTAGYHNHADPWLEERYVSSNLTKQQAARLIESRVLDGLDLLGFQGQDRQLDGLRAIETALRDANFSGASLRSADFSKANLSNADFRNCNLREAVFRGTDLEGADFGGADVRDADFTGASLFGASFVEPAEEGQRKVAAKLSSIRQLTDEQLSMLTDEQQTLLRQACAE